MSVLATIATANAAYSVIKTCLANGSEINGIIGQVGKFLSAEDDLKEAVKRKKSSPIAAITGSSEGDWEAFQALEDLKEKRGNDGCNHDHVCWLNCFGRRRRGHLFYWSSHRKMVRCGF